MMLRNICQISRFPILSSRISSIQYRFSQSDKPGIGSNIPRNQTNNTPLETTQSGNLNNALDQQVEKQMLTRLYQLGKQHKEQQQIIDKQIKFPIKLCGTKDQYEKRYSYLPQRIMGYYRIPYSSINKYLLNMYKASLYAIADRNTEYMNEYWEEGLKLSVLKSIDEVKAKSYKFKVDEDRSYLEDIDQSCQIVDSIMMRGLSLNRNQNQNPSQYTKFSEAYEVGLITYTPKRLTSDNENFIDPKKNKNVYDGYDKMILRTLVRIKSPLRLSIDNFNIPNELYTWEHICVFENQMVAPKHMESSYKLQTLMEWLGKYRFGQWKIVDIDNYMKGNSPFRNHYPPEEEIEPVFKGTKLDKSYYIDIRMI